MKHTYTFLAGILAITSQAQVTHELQVLDDEFNPANLTIAAGDHVHIIWGSGVTNDHDFTQVSETTWITSGATPLAGGFAFGVGTANPGTDFTITPTADVWYVCSFHVSMGMKGKITVTGGIGMDEPIAQQFFTLAPNPVNDVVTVLGSSTDPVVVRLTDASGRACVNTTVDGDRTILTSDLGAGIYVVELRDREGVLLSRQRLLIAR